jgi:UPF0042 nucleotide-binding protein
LAQGGVLLEAIRTERKMLEEVRGRANIIVDTSNLTPRELNAKLSSYFSENKTGDFNINIVSFGYKVGIPVDCDIMMDVRFLPNPFYDPLCGT